MKAALMICLLLAGCGERDEALANGYRFVELSRGNGAIVKGNDFVVYPNVVELQQHGSIVTGRRILAQDNTDMSVPFTEGLGYFVLDTATGRVRQGLARLPAPTPP